MYKPSGTSLQKKLVSLPLYFLIFLPSTLNKSKETSSSPTDNFTEKLSLFSDQWKPRVVAEMNDYFRFGFVRNPWARLYSCYRDKILGPTLRDQQFILGHFGFTPGMAFADFVRGVAEIPDEEADGHFVGQF